MRLEHYPEEKLKKEILEIVGKHLDLQKYKVFVFGSRVAGKGDNRSDVDIGIEGPEPVEFSTLTAIQEEFEEAPILYKIDIIDFTDASENFRKVAKEHREMLN